MNDDDPITLDDAIKLFPGARLTHFGPNAIAGILTFSVWAGAIIRSTRACSAGGSGAPIASRSAAAKPASRSAFSGCDSAAANPATLPESGGKNHARSTTSGCGEIGCRRSAETRSGRHTHGSGHAQGDRGEPVVEKVDGGAR